MSGLSNIMSRKAVHDCKTAMFPSQSSVHDVPSVQHVVKMGTFAHEPTSRRALLTNFGLVTGGSQLLQYLGPASSAAAWLPNLGNAQPQQLAPRSALVPCTAKWDGSIAAMFTSSVYRSVVEQGIMDETDFQRKNFILRDREFPYYKEANKGRMSALPDLSDLSGGLSQPLYFNFVYYITWKIVARHVKGAADRTAFCRDAGGRLLSQVWPEGLQMARQAAEKGGGRASEADVVSILQQHLDILQTAGYCCRYQIVWGEQPGGWPQDWMISQPNLTGANPDTTSPAPSGLVFQIKMHEPADIEGSVALRSEEDGFWSRAVSSMQYHLLTAAGYKVDQNSVDEFFYQDTWQGPRSLADKVLLFLGDPLEQVGIDFIPTSLVQNWELR